MSHTTTYKQTPIGLIPNDWEVKKLGEIVKITSGISPTLIKLSSETRNFPYLKVEDLNNCDKYQLFSREYSDEEKLLVRKNSIIFPKRGAAILNNKVRINRVSVLMDSNLMAITANEKKVFFEYLFYTILRVKLYKIADTSTIPQINNKHIEPYQIPLPPLPEQQKIAEILSTWDAAIDNCKTLIEQLKNRNKGLAQQLLTGKMRVKGFEGTKWKILAIDKIAKQISIKNPSDKELIVLSCTKYDGLVPSLEYFGRKIFSDDLTTYKIVKKGQFAYATNHIEEGSIGYQSKFDEALISPMYTVFQTDETINDSLLFRILKSHHYIHEYQKRMEGSIDRRGGLRWDKFSKIKVPIFELEEQQAIANILDTATAELAQMQQKLQTLQLQKKGLMQQLLTGKVRVKI